MSRCHRFVFIGICIGVWLSVSVSPAAAQAHAGVRAGISSDPTQFYFGGHVETKPLFDHVTFRPNAELGLGNGLTTFAANFEFVYSIPIQKQPWRVYMGAGPALLVFSGDEPDDTVGGGFNILIGLQHREGFLTELKVGFADSPSVKFAVGYAFK